MSIDIGRIGIWSGQLRRGDTSRTPDAVAELESLGYGAVWMPGGAGSGFFPLAEACLRATSRIVVAAGILSVWTNTAEDVARARATLAADHPGRFLLGLGVSHPSAVERLGRRFEHPVPVMRDYLDALDATSSPVSRDELVLAALGPRMLALSRDRSWGAHPYFVPPEHTRLARFVLGPRALVAPEQAVVLETDPERARRIARQHVGSYLGSPNYTNNLLRLGFAAADFANGGTDRLVDAIVAWGDLEAVGRRIDEHMTAGADHVCVQVLTEDPSRLPLDEWRTVARLIGHG